MTRPKNHISAQLGLPDKGRTIKELLISRFLIYRSFGMLISMNNVIFGIHFLDKLSLIP